MSRETNASRMSRAYTARGVWGGSQRGGDTRAHTIHGRADQNGEGVTPEYRQLEGKEIQREITLTREIRARGNNLLSINSRDIKFTSFFIFSSVTREEELSSSSVINRLCIRNLFSIRSHNSSIANAWTARRAQTARCKTLDTPITSKHWSYNGHNDWLI